jgi:hypothetical protein
MRNHIDFAIEDGNILDYPADVVALKYARQPFGADKAARQRLLAAGLRSIDLEPAIGTVSVQETLGALKSPLVAFVGTPRLGEFGYPEIRRFMDRALNTVVGDYPGTTHLAMTVHGPESRLKTGRQRGFPCTVHGLSSRYSDR